MQTNHKRQSQIVNVCNNKIWLYSVFAGCSISGNEASVSISRYSGESVFLPCLIKCSGRHNPDKFRWKFPNNREINQRTNSAELNRLYQGRFHMFDKKSGNFSLLISNLMEKDEGLYSCGINENQHKSFNLTVKGKEMWILCETRCFATQFH